ncbi:flavodoxin [Vibrio tritonius]|uniref:flavodoxin n=1 Tax=Vibrio tritonius TaxID=1435069 RepID=UPI00315D1B22
MTQVTPRVFQVKNSWLWQQVDVKFPTVESLRGRDCYQALLADREVVSLTLGDAVTDCQLEGVFLVDFHRLTVMFAVLQSTLVQDESAQSDLVEFFTQIIYSEPCSLYLGFADSVPVAAALVTKENNEVLVSDVVVKTNLLYPSCADFIQAVVQKSGVVQTDAHIWLEQPIGKSLLG